VEHLIADDRCRKAIEVMERYADGAADHAELRAAGSMAHKAEWDWGSKAGEGEVQYILARAVRRACQGEVYHVASGVALAVELAMGEGKWGVGGRIRREYQPQSDILRDLFGNLFSPVMADSSWLSPGVVQLAQFIYEGRAFNWLPELADALELTGCSNQEMLRHFRHHGEHVRGCWVVDLILGKK
jgi:hypothetical protein